MRKWITILLTLSLLLTLAACGKKEEAPPEEDIPAQGDDSALPDNTPEENAGGGNPGDGRGRYLL